VAANVLLGCGVAVAGCGVACCTAACCDAAAFCDASRCSSRPRCKPPAPVPFAGGEAGCWLGWLLPARFCS